MEYGVSPKDSIATVAAHVAAAKGGSEPVAAVAADAAGAAAADAPKAEGKPAKKSRKA